MTESPATPPPSAPPPSNPRLPAGVARGMAHGKRIVDVKKDPPPTGMAAWWPVLIGVGIDFIAQPLKLQLDSYGIWVTRAVFPFMQIFGMHELGFSDQLTQSLPQLMLYLQFPLEGAFVGFSLSRGAKLGTAIAQLVFLHLLCLFVMWLMSQSGR